MNETEETGALEAAPATLDAAPPARIPTGIDPLDERSGGLVSGGSYLMVGTPGPAKMVAALQYLHAGLLNGERVGLVTGADLDGILEASAAWGLPLQDAWLDGRAVILGFRDDFELRAARSVVPEEVVDELQRELGPGLERIAVDPGALFLQRGTKTLLGGAFLRWAKDHPATVLTTYSVDEAAGQLPAAADWLLHAVTGRVVVERRNPTVYQMTLVPTIPEGTDENAAATVELRPGQGLLKPTGIPALRGEDRGALDPDKLLLVTLNDAGQQELTTWATASFQTRSVTDSLDAVTAVQGDSRYGAVLISATRGDVREAIQACRALRPLTRSALVFASDDAIRGSDRIQLLEAGADECLTGGLDFRELGLRIRQAVASGTRAPAPDLPIGEDAPAGGFLDAPRFRAELRRRADDPTLGVFSLLRFRGLNGELTRLQQFAEEEIRAEEGDLVSVEAGELRILLQGARGSQARPFLHRLQGRLRDASGSAPEPDILSHPGDAAQIAQLTEEAGGGTG